MFYTIIIKSNSQAIYKYDNEKAAYASLHHEQEYSINANEYCLCMVINAEGAVVKYDKTEPTA